MESTGTRQSEMKQDLLLFLSSARFKENVPVAATLAWLAASRNHLFDNYFDSYRQGIHFGGGDARKLEQGQLTGGTVSGDHHFEEFYLLLHNFDVSIVCLKETIFLSAIRNLRIPVLSQAPTISDLYREVFRSLDTPLPLDIVMIGTRFEEELAGLEAYLYPEVYHRRAMGIPDTIPEEQLMDLCQEGSRFYCLYVDDRVLTQLVGKGYAVEVIDQLNTGDDYGSVTARCANRWLHKTKGWILGDPTLVAHWIPKACEEGLTAVYSIPQDKAVSDLGDLIASKGNVVYGRQYSDRDFFTLSKLNQCLQVIDPSRPPFQSMKHAAYSWEARDHAEEGFFGTEYTDDELRQFVREKRILISLMFWSGMIRELENFHNLFDLFAMLRLRCGLVLTAQSFEYMMHSPLELITIPVEQGGVFPLVEPVLGSCGIGVGIESSMSCQRLGEDLVQGLDRIRQRVKNGNYLPRGWWATMDVDLEKISAKKKPKPIEILKYSPYVRIRYQARDKSLQDASSSRGGIANPLEGYFEKMKETVRKAGWSKHFLPYRPYEFYEAGPIKEEILKTVRSAGLQYTFTKAGFNSCPEAKYIDDDFIALNYTSGQWDGWTPFETINDVTDLSRTEKKLLKSRKPGWIVSTIDSCLWTFSGEFWKRGTGLYDIARFCAGGGASERLLNVKPYTIARYARIMAEMDSSKVTRS